MRPFAEIDHISPDGETPGTLLVKLPYPYGKPQIYLPTDLLTVGAMLENSGISTQLLDLNLSQLPPPEALRRHSKIGIAVFGAPYIPGARALLDQLRPLGVKLLVGGQAVEKLGPEAARETFGADVCIVSSNSDLERAYDLSAGELRSEFETSIVSTFSKLPARVQREYLSREFSFFVSQGCKFRCDFCAAQKQRAEEYRSLEAIRTDLLMLSITAIRRELSELKLYLSPLDLFQNPQRLAEVLEEFVLVQEGLPVRYQLRGLSRADSMVSALETLPELGKLAVRAGLRVVGFGVDGTTERVWRSQHKGQISLSLMDRALDLCRGLKITPELLMVMGFPQDNLRSLFKNIAYMFSRSLSHAAVSRPYLAKCCVPGSVGWHDPNFSDLRQKLRSQPDLFLNLDFAAFASRLTHPRRWQRWISNLSYGLIVGLMELRRKNTTYPLLPRISRERTTLGLRNACASYFNSVVPFDR